MTWRVADYSESPMDEVIEQGWQSAFSVMQANFDLTDDAIGVFAINLRFNLDDIQTIASEAITGGGDDKKCDILYVDKERQAAVIAQCYISKKPRPAAPANKASDLNTALTWLLSADIESLPDTLKGRADELRSAINAGEIKQFYNGTFITYQGPQTSRTNCGRSRIQPAQY
jgi:hypothetical protein